MLRRAMAARRAGPRRRLSRRACRHGPTDVAQGSFRVWRWWNASVVAVGLGGCIEDGGVGDHRDRRLLITHAHDDPHQHCTIGSARIDPRCRRQPAAWEQGTVVTAAQVQVGPFMSVFVGVLEGRALPNDDDREQ